MSLVLAFGNPVLDSVVKLKNKDIINKFKLQEDGHKQTTPEEMQDILKEIKQQKYTWSNVAGGSALNTMRILQWLFDHERSTVVFGAVGTDSNATLLKNMVEEFRVKTKFAFLDKQPTGWVLSLVYKSSRSLIAHIGAAECYAVQHFDNAENRLLIKESNLIYMEGFFITERKEVSRHILDLCKAEGKPFVFNLNAEYLVTELRDEMMHFVENSSILFGNSKEFSKLAKGIGVSKEELIKKLVAGKSDKLLVVTNGPKSVHAYYQNEVIKYEVPTMKPSEIVDTTGCGDSFVAGFIFGHLNGLPPLRCMKWGAWMAQQVIRQIGCTPPGRLLPTDIRKVE